MRLRFYFTNKQKILKITKKCHTFLRKGELWMVFTKQVIAKTQQKIINFQHDTNNISIGIVKYREKQCVVMLV